MKNNFRYQLGCSNCKFVIRRSDYDDGWKYYCGLDQEVNYDMLNIWYEDISSELFDHIDDIIVTHKVSATNICDDFENKT